MAKGLKQKIGVLIADLAGVQMRLDELRIEMARKAHPDLIAVLEDDMIGEASRMIDDVIDLLREVED